MLANQSYRNRFAILFGINERSIDDDTILNSLQRNANTSNYDEYDYLNTNLTNFNNIHHNLIRENINQIISEDLNNIRNYINNQTENQHNNYPIVNHINNQFRSQYDNYPIRNHIDEESIIDESFQNYNYDSQSNSQDVNAFLNSLNTIKLKNEEQCNICFENINKDTLTYDLSCKHYFHINCIKEWFKQNLSCPVCRKQFKVE